MKNLFVTLSSVVMIVYVAYRGFETFIVLPFSGRLLSPIGNYSLLLVLVAAVSTALSFTSRKGVAASLAVVVGIAALCFWVFVIVRSPWWMWSNFRFFLVPEVCFMFAGLYKWRVGRARVVRRMVPEDKCVAVISGRVVGEELGSTSPFAVSQKLVFVLRDGLMSNEFNVSEVEIDKLHNAGFHCDIQGGRVIMILLEPPVRGADRQFRILYEIKDEAAFKNDTSIHQIRDFVSRFWSANSERVEWVTWKEADDRAK